jgi:CRP-like cAMP-binding protein
LAEQLTDINILKKIPIFSSLSDSDLAKILKAPENGIIEYGMKETIIKESEIGECMYVVLDGSVEVSMRGLGREISIATLRPGDFFGEQALTVMDATGRRNATVKSLHKARLFRIDKKYVQLTLKNDNIISEDLTVPNKSSQAHEVRALIKGMRLFEALKESELNSIDTWTEVTTVGPGDFVIKESEKGNCLYVVLSGSVEIFTLDENGKITVLACHERGGYFGEQALLPGSSGTRSAYARANGKTRLIRIPKAYFRLILNRDSALAESLSQLGKSQQKQREEASKK